MRPILISLLIIFLLLISLPYIFAFITAGPDYVFGGFLINPIDGNSYLAKMYQGWRGEWRFALPYSAEPGEGAYLFLFYLFLGHLARLANLPSILVFHAARLLATGLMVLALYRFLDEFLVDTTQPLLIFTAALMGLGFGYLVFPFGVITSDFWVAETYPYLSAFANPHFPLGLALVLWLIVLTYRCTLSAEASKSQTHNYSLIWISLLTITSTLVLSIVAPFGVVISLMVLVGWLLVMITQWIFDVRSTEIHIKHARAMIPIQTLVRQILLIALGGVPIVVYDVLIANLDPVLAGWNAQNLTPSPPFWDLAISMSPALILALLGVWKLVHEKPSREWIILIWALLGFGLLYFPVDLQRRFMMGLYVPVVGLAAIGLGWLNKKWSTRAANRTGKLMLIFSLPTVLVLLFVAIYGIQTREPLYFLTDGESRAFEWIELNTPPKALIMASPDTGLFIPAHTGRRVIYGHPFETVNAQDEEAAVLAFFAGAGDDDGAILVEREVDYVYYGPREQLLGNLQVTSQLMPVYSQKDVTIYQVLDNFESDRSGDL